MSPKKLAKLSVYASEKDADSRIELSPYAKQPTTIDKLVEKINQLEKRIAEIEQRKPNLLDGFIAPDIKELFEDDEKWKELEDENDE